MTIRKSRSTPLAKAFSRNGNRSLLLAGVGLVAVTVLGALLVTPREGINPDLRAGLIDQLSPSYPSEEFRSGVEADVEGFGLPLDVYDGEQVDVDLYRGIGAGNYGVLVIRSHSGILEAADAADETTTALFTNEPYSESRHVVEQISERVLIVRPFEGDRELTFGIAPSFIRKSMQGGFPGTVVVVAGCSVLGRTDLAQALVERGASVIISWDRSVGLEHADEATGLLLHYLLAEGMTVEKAAVSAMAEAGPDPEFGAILKYYPTSAGRYTAAQLLLR